MSTTPSQIQPLKQRLEATWTAGDYGIIAKGLQRSAEAFLSELSTAPGERLLDVACGAGQIAVPAARSGARATGIDIAPNWIDQARARAETEGVELRLDVGDVEAMPYEDQSFDVVVSLIGAMFAPRPELAASEMLRVCRSGGRVVMGNWTPEGFIGEFFKTVGRYVPPPDMPSPLLWGDEQTVRDRFAQGVSDLTLERKTLQFDYPFPPSEVVEHFFRFFGPAQKAFDALDDDGREALRRDLQALWSRNNQAENGTTRVDAGILQVTAVRQ